MLLDMKNKRNKLERKLDEYNHTMELVRTIVPIAVLVLQVIILTKFVWRRVKQKNVSEYRYPSASIMLA